MKAGSPQGQRISRVLGLDTGTLHARVPLVFVGLALLVPSWTLLWTRTTFWNPVFFWGTWTGGTLLMYAFGRWGYPGLRRHLLLAVVSVPLWWWFELVNKRVGNWEYISAYDYNRVEYFLFASLAFSTVGSALDAASRLTERGPLSSSAPGSAFGRRGYVGEIAVGVILVLLLFPFPDVFFPLTWVGPFAVCDGLVGYWGGRSLASELRQGEWRLAAAIGSAGLLCGFLWEFWNFWASPKWVYDVPVFDFLHVFEMPLMGYGGYIPFGWSVYQLLRLCSMFGQAPWTKRRLATG